MWDSPFNLVRRVVWSWHGCVDAWRNEVSFRSWVYANIISIALTFILPVSEIERLIIIVLGILVLAAELLNTALERLCDLVEPENNPLIKASKDAGSGAVALTSIAAGAAWVMALI